MGRRRRKRRGRRKQPRCPGAQTSQHPHVPFSSMVYLAVVATGTAVIVGGFCVIVMLGPLSRDDHAPEAPEPPQASPALPRAHAHHTWLLIFAAISAICQIVRASLSVARFLLVRPSEERRLRRSEGNRRVVERKTRGRSRCLSTFVHVSRAVVIVAFRVVMAPVPLVRSALPPARAMCVEVCLRLSYPILRRVRPDWAERLRTEHSTLWRRKAARLRDSAQHALALRAVDRAIVLAPDEPRALYVKSLILSSMGQKQQARRLFVRAVLLRPSLWREWAGE